MHALRVRKEKAIEKVAALVSTIDYRLSTIDYRLSTSKYRSGAPVQRFDDRDDRLVHSFDVRFLSTKHQRVPAPANISTTSVKTAETSAIRVS
jgi:hypothetical protein